MDEKICPLMTAGTSANINCVDQMVLCRREECAWWIEEKPDVDGNGRPGRCAIVRIARMM